jgi:hypothetical protein
MEGQAKATLEINPTLLKIQSVFEKYAKKKSPHLEAKMGNGSICLNNKGTQVACTFSESKKAIPINTIEGYEDLADALEKDGFVITHKDDLNFFIMLEN